MSILTPRITLDLLMILKIKKASACFRSCMLISVLLIALIAKFSIASETLNSPPECESFKFIPEIVAFIGAPFSGKGTQAALLSKLTGINVLSTADLYRAEARSGSEVGIEMGKLMAQNILLPGTLTDPIFRKAVKSLKFENGIILDGTPRSIKGLTELQSLLLQVDKQVGAFIFMESRKEVLETRVSSRRFCLACSSISTAENLSLKPPCCSDMEIYQRPDDTLDGFNSRFARYETQLIPLVHHFQVEYPELLIRVPADVASSTNVKEIHDFILKELKALKTRHIRSKHYTSFDWLDKVNKTVGTVSEDDLKFFLQWALDENLANKSGILRRVIFLATRNDKKTGEYLQTFGAYGIEVIRIPRMQNYDYLFELKTDTFTPLAVLKDSSNLFRPRPEKPYSLENIANAELSSLNRGTHCVNVCVLSVIVKKKGGQVEKSQIIAQVPGYIRSDVSTSSTSTDVFGWDDQFIVSELGLSLYQLKRKGFKHSARDLVLSQFIKEYIYYSQKNNLRFHPIESSTAVDFSNLPETFFYRLPEYNLNLVREYGFVALWQTVCSSGTFFRSATSRRLGTYWNPGINGGLPLVKKADPIHELTFMAHDIGHQLLPDLVYTGDNSFQHMRIYIMWRMMSEAFTMTLADMVFIDALKKENIQYDFSKRNIYPLFESLNLEITPATPDRIENIRKIVHANFMYCLTGKDEEYRELIIKNNPIPSFEALDKFKEKFAPFFVEDFRWTLENYRCMVSRRSAEARAWWKGTERLRHLLKDTSILSIDDFRSKCDSDSVQLETIFTVAFEKHILPVLKMPGGAELKADEAPNRLFKGFVRWMTGQLSICFKFDFIPESEAVVEKIINRLSELNGRITLEEVLKIRSWYNEYLDRLLELTLISPDDRNTYSEVYPLFDPFFVSYDKKSSEYENIAALTDRILNNRPHHFSFYHKMAKKILNSFLSESVEAANEAMYQEIELGNGLLQQGIFVVIPGIKIVKEDISKFNFQFLISGITESVAIQLLKSKISLQFIDDERDSENDESATVPLLFVASLDEPYVIKDTIHILSSLPDPCSLSALPANRAISVYIQASSEELLHLKHTSKSQEIVSIASRCQEMVSKLIDQQQSSSKKRKRSIGSSLQDAIRPAQRLKNDK